MRTLYSCLACFFLTAAMFAASHSAQAGSISDNPVAFGIFVVSLPVGVQFILAAAKAKD